MRRRAAIPLLLLPLVTVTSARSETGQVHRVQAGESLWTIAAHTIGDPTLWPALYLANRDQIKDPSRVYPGQELAIPRVDPGERDALRREARTLVPR